MARSGSENRQRRITLKARFNDAEAALILEQAERAGVSVASLIRYAVLGQPPLRSGRNPAVGHQAAAQLLAGLGQVATELRRAGADAGEAENAAIIEAAHRDLAEMRALLFEALGRLP
ncbi:MAG TPA: hypothetical protein PKA33_17830 [Amaricoccus sp.]|uniref:plasmid mobilization protein n=1 Tax=Amaricoccus sp. TaxID=1872485 RepID=UPI002C8164D2|nr:hypothetical protein [Amaricoccus sp.]HMQ92843.1 hypothetical protein [Amaricoccus sp.]HMR37053.1 hypothetical protein [Paracoccus sp. (in: a-proteobacteria)]HMR54163.1 hypothetical protein [Amaricoccus sp.]HMU01208.1 hypothetical protein [Amaricoccus sp.]